MILVDTSVWIDLLGRQPRHRIAGDQWHQVATCPVIIQEILQGIQNELAAARIRESLLALPRLGDPASVEAYLEAAEIYRLGRRKGLTIRSSVDCLIAALAIRNSVAVWHQDSDFRQIARFTSLREVDRI